MDGENRPNARWVRVKGAAVVMNVMRHVLTAYNPKPPSGHASEWIADFRFDPENWKFVWKIFKALMDPRNLGLFRRSIEESLNELEKFAPQLRNHDLSPFNIVLRQFGAKIGVQQFVNAFPDAAGLRAFQIRLKCVLYYRTSPEILIALAKSGDKQATLQLIRVDFHFLNDPCTAGVIEKAGRDNDYGFRSELRTALKTSAENLAFKITAKDLVRLGLYFCCSSAHKLTKAQLRDLLDPECDKFKRNGFDEFVKDVRREIKKDWQN
jgi:hypothetical protein